MAGDGSAWSTLDTLAAAALVIDQAPGAQRSGHVGEVLSVAEDPGAGAASRAKAPVGPIVISTATIAPENSWRFMARDLIVRRPSSSDPVAGAPRRYGRRPARATWIPPDYGPPWPSIRTCQRD
jgi:hypothetical protein